jgi:proline iminopeptidase
MRDTIRGRWCFLVLGMLLLGASPATGAEDAQVSEGRLKTPDGVELFYQKVGSGKQVVIIPAGLFTYDGLRPLASKGRTLIFYDMRNRGRSEHITDMEKISIEADVRDLETVRRHFGVKKFTPVGYSYLGLMVMLYAKDHPGRVERIVQLGPVPRKFGTKFPPQYDNTGDRSVFDGAQWEELKRLQRKGFDKSHPREYCEKDWAFVRVMLVAAPPKNLERLPDNCGLENEWPVNFERHMEKHFVGSVMKLDVPTAEFAKSIKQPLLTIHGRKDRNAPYGAGREWAALLPNARLLTLENAAHNSWADEPETVVRAIDEFLKGKWVKQGEKVHRD